MANYCSNSIVFYSGDKAKLSVFLRKMSAAYNARGSHFYSFMVLHGYGNREISSVIDKRDFFTSCDTKLSVKDNTYSFSMDTETAWAPHMEVFRKVLQERYGNQILMVYMAEECGCGVYINSDTEGKYFPERYMVDCCHAGEFHKEYFDTYEDAVEWIQGEYKDFGFGLFDTVEDVERKVRDISAMDEDGFFCFRRFEPEAGPGAERGVA